MKATVLESPGHLVLRDVPAPTTVASSSAVVRVRVIGVCGTDFHAYQGNQPLVTYPRILGHELGVEVLAVGDGIHGLRPGQRAAVEPYLNCGRCAMCEVGRTNCCIAIQVLGVHTDGGMCELLVVPVSKLHTSESLTFEQLAWVEPLSVGMHAVTRARPGPADSVLVVGAGPIGLSVVLHVLGRGATVTLADEDERRLLFAESVFGGAARVVRVDPGTSGSVRRAIEPRRPSIVFDATGNIESMERSIELASPGGRVAFVGLAKGSVCFEDASFHGRELEILASRNATPADFQATIELLEEGRVDLRTWVTDRSPFEESIERFHHWAMNAAPLVKAHIVF